MPDFDLNIDFEVWCSCGNSLCNQASTNNSGKSPSVTIEPCEKCINSARDEGYDDGYEQGLDEGRSESE